MGRQSQARERWSKRHDAPTRHTLRVWICADCQARGCQLITCVDGTQRCATCKAAFDRQRDAMQAAPRPAQSPIVPAGQLVTPPRVG